MCGIAGFVGAGELGDLERMLARLVHRGPDAVGRHVEPGVALGARRLRVIDLEGGHQPMTNETETVWVAFNGEIYNYRELRYELSGKGHRFTSQCDTEVLVHLYEQEGEEGVRRLRGMFAYALWDRSRHTLFLVRDRLGIKPLFYAPQGQGPDPDHGLAFASELPSLLEAMRAPSLAPETIFNYLTHLYVPSPGTVYRGVRQVRPGEMLRIHKGRIDSWQYARLDEPVELIDPADAATAAASFREMLRETVQAHLLSDVPLGLFLSGGLDSGAILAAMRQVTNGPIRTVSVGYAAAADRSYDELSAARTLAKHFGTDHAEARLEPDAVALLPRIVEAMGEPFADASAIPTYLVAEFARRSVTVALSGIGGDELFGGYPRYLGLRVAARYAWAPASLRSWIAARVASRLPDSSHSRNYQGRLRRFLSEGHLPLAQQYLRWTSFLPPEWGESAFTAAFWEAARPHDHEIAYHRLFDAWPAEDPSDRAMGLDLQTYLPDDLLRMGDRLSMAHSLELRVPFCDDRVVQFARRIPPALRFSGFRLKGFMRDALKPLLPSSIVRRPKFGFQVPLSRWLREDLREMVHDVLSEQAVRRRGYLKPEYVHWLIDQHESRARNFSDQLYALLVLELWHQHLEAGSSVSSARAEAPCR